jgi:hypothetical protein
MTLFLLEDTLQIDIFYECEDHDLEDNICISVIERCPPDERLLRSGETHIFLTIDEARQLGEALISAADHSHSGGNSRGD